MNRAPRWLVVGVTLGCGTACLPDPPAYDPCSEKQSEYYTVDAKGCNGHELVVLEEIEYEQRMAEFAGGVGGLGVPTSDTLSTLGIDERFVYFVSPDRKLRETSKQGNSHAVLYESDADFLSLLTIERSTGRIYLAETNSKPEFPPTARVIGIDLATHEARILAEFSGYSLFRAAMADERLFIAPAYGSGVLTATLDWSEVADAGDLSVAVSEYVTDLIALDRALYFVASSIAAVQRYDIDTGRIDTIYEWDLTTGMRTVRLAMSDDTLWMQECVQPTAECTWYRLSPGELPAAVTLAYQSCGATIAADAHGTYTVGSFWSSGSNNSRMLSWSGIPLSPQTVAAPFCYGSVVLGLDATFIYAQIGKNEGYMQQEGGEAVFRTTTRLLRIRR